MAGVQPISGVQGPGGPWNGDEEPGRIHATGILTIICVVKLTGSIASYVRSHKQRVVFSIFFDDHPPKGMYNMIKLYQY